MVSKEFLNNLSRIIEIASEPCECENSGECNSCISKEFLENLSFKIEQIISKLGE